MAASAEDEAARGRIGQILGFLKEFNELRRPVQRAIPYPNQPRPIRWSELSPCAALAVSLPGAAPAGAEGDDVVLRVRRTELERAPAPPTEGRAWLKAGWDSPNSEAEWHSTRNEHGEEVGIDEDTELDLMTWKDDRDAWAKRVRPFDEANALFHRLWDLHGRFERESESAELVLGDGHARWARGSVAIDHPVLLQPVELEFDPQAPEFRVTVGNREPEFAQRVFDPPNTAPVDGPQLVDAAALGRFREQAKLLSPLAGDPATTFLKELATTLDGSGDVLFDGELRRPGESLPPSGPELRVYRDPVLFVRPRTAGYAKAIDDARSSLAERDLDGLPRSLLALAGVFPEKVDTGDVPADRWSLPDEEDDALLTLPANREQLQILRRLEKHHNVLVQGPPGTGKTHTIANLLGHLLAEGKTVLVTAQTPKALRVLRDKVAKPLQPLCVSVLEGDAASNAQLRDSAQAISERLASADSFAIETGGLKDERVRLLERIREHRAQLLALVRSEYEPLAADEWRGTPAEAARKLVADAEHGWIPGPLLGAERQLSVPEVYALYETNGTLAPEDVADIEAGLPALGSLPPPQVFREALAAADRGQPIRHTGEQFWVPGIRTAADIEAFRRSALDLFTNLAEAEEWELAAIAAGAGEASGMHGWIALRGALNAHALAAQTRDGVALAHGPQVALTWPAEELLRRLDEMAAHVRGGGRFGKIVLLKNGAWKAVLQNCRTIEGSPETLDRIEALRAAPLAEMARDRAAARWDLVLGSHGLPFPEQPTAARDWVERIDDALAAAREWFEPERVAATELGLDLPGLLSIPLPPTDPHAWRTCGAEGVARLPAVLDAELARMDIAAFARLREDIRANLAPHRHVTAAVTALAEAVEAGAVGGYEESYNRVASLSARSEAARRRKELLARLEDVAPAWATAVRNRTDPHGAADPPGDIRAAWSWLVLKQELDRVTAGEAAPFLAAITRDRQQLARVTLDLAERRAWRSLAQRTTPAALTSLKAYTQAVRLIGRGTGLRARHLEPVVRRAMEQSRDAVPAWIAPLYRVAETFDAKSARFDVVIIDEASQLDPTGLLAWFFGKQVIVVGDDEQVTPEAVGVRQVDVEALIAKWLEGIPNKELYLAQTSVYHLAQLVFHETVRLREHFRCVPDIIGFSNGLSYNWDIQPLRNAADGHVLPPVVPEYVEDGARGERMVNQEEAERVASLLIAATEQPEYDGLTFGVIPLLGSGEQAQRIELLLHRELSPEVIERRRILCGTPPHFQGDERDVVFLSMVDGPPDSGVHRLRGEGAGDMFKKRYNVAVSRARDQLWVVHSVRREELQPKDIRRRLLEFAHDPSEQQRKLAELYRHAQSPFEAEVGRRLQARGYDFRPQHPAGAFFLDFLVTDGNKHLAVECDGEKWHSSPEKVREDLDRQALLERLGYTFYRIRGGQYYRGQDGTMEGLFAHLREMGIEPAADPGSPPAMAPSSELVERVRARAREIRDSWHGRTGPDPAPEDEDQDSDGGPPVGPDPPPPPGPPGNGPSDPGPVTEEHPEPPPPPSPSAASEAAPAPPPAPPPSWLPGGFVQYQEATLAGLRRVRTLGEESDSLLHPMIVEVARVEGPAHFEAVMERLRIHYGMGRAREPTRKHVLRATERLASSGRVRMVRFDAEYDLFLSLPDTAITPRMPGISGPRASRHIAPEELGAGLLALASTHGVVRDGLILAAAREFGFRRMSEQLKQALEDVLDVLLRRGSLVEQRGHIARPG